MPGCRYKGRGVGKGVVLNGEPVSSELIRIDKGVIHLVAHPERLVQYKDRRLSSLLVVVSSGCLDNRYTFDCFVRFGVRRYITFFSCEVHDGTVGSAYDCIGMRIQFQLTEYG